PLTPSFYPLPLHDALPIYSIPQLMILGRGPEAFKDRNGNPVPGWKILAGHALAIANDRDGNRPDVKQVQVASPQPFIEQLRDFRDRKSTRLNSSHVKISYA